MIDEADGKTKVNFARVAEDQTGKDLPPDELRFFNETGASFAMKYSNVPAAISTLTSAAV